MTKIVSNERRLRGRSVSRGIGVGKVRLINSRGRRLSKIPIQECDVPYELKRLRTAFKIAERSLKRLVKGPSGHAADSRGEIFLAQLEMLRDPGLMARMEEEVQGSLVNSEWAIQRASRDVSQQIGSLPDPKFRERAIDIQDLGERLINALSGRNAKTSPDGEYVVVTDQLFPSALAEFGSNLPVAIITERGGWTSHAFILARELGIPAVTGLHGATRRMKDGSLVLVDGFSGEIFLDPKEQRISRLPRKAIETSDEFCELVSEPGPATTTDGIDIQLSANLDVPKSFEMLRETGSMGIGLFRSEFLIHPGSGFPSEREQVVVYEQLGRLAGKFRARIRTFDVNSGEAQGDSDHFERNPALGLRATRLMLTHEPKEFRTQLRALLRASANSPIDLILPMVSDISEIRDTKELIATEKQRLSEKGIAVGDPRVGVMIEVPSLLLMLDKLFAEVDFVSLGTNDLVQYLLAVDRDNESVADSFRSLHPAVLRAIKRVVAVADEAGKELLVCGEMAGSFLYAPILVGLGVRNLSMNVRAISRVRNILKSISAETASRLAESLLDCSSAKESEQVMLSFYERNWPNIFPRSLLVQTTLARRNTP